MNFAIPLIVLAGLFMRGCEDAAPTERAEAIGDIENGVALIKETGCGSCHIIPGIYSARGLVGPPLDHMARRAIIAGLLQNTPDNMVTWLRAPQKIVPGNAMPDLGLSQQQARDITAYLYTLD